MGLTFHYRGKLREATLLPALVEEVEDICQVLGWKIQLFSSVYENNTFVKSSNDPKCDPVILCFDGEGTIWVPWLKDILKANIDGGIKVITVQLDLTEGNKDPIISESNQSFEPNNLVHQVHVKTQDAGSEMHIKVVELLRYLSEKYLKEFELDDEGDYFDTRDISVLDYRNASLHDFIDKFQDLLSDKKINSAEDFIKLLRTFGKKYGKDQSNNENIE